jgi:hypothetical protein
METEEILQILAWSEHPMMECAGARVIMADRFSETAESIAAIPEVDKPKEEIEKILIEQSKRFSACGANNSEKWAVLRKNPKSGWTYIVKLILNTDD